MLSLINTCMIWNIELLSECKSHRAACSATRWSDTALLFLHRNVNFSPDRFISTHFRWIVGRGSALPTHPLSSSPLGPIKGAGAENKWNAVAKQRLLQNLALNLKISLWSEVELAGWYSLWSCRFCICCQLIEWILWRNRQRWMRGHIDCRHRRACTHVHKEGACALNIKCFSIPFNLRNKHKECAQRWRRQLHIQWKRHTLLYFYGPSLSL